MRLEIRDIWSPDLSPPSSGLPSDILDFEVFIQISISEVGQSGNEVFNCTVCSASALANIESGKFICHTLVLDEFDWATLKSRIEKLLLHTTSCKDWDCVIKKLYSYIQYADMW